MENSNENYLQRSITIIQLVAFSLIVMIACQKKDGKATSSGLKDLTSFPKDWVLIVNSTPDSIIAKYAIPVNTDSTFYGELTIDTTKMSLVYKDFDTVLEYDIVKCEMVNEAEMVYYQFKLLTKSAADSAWLNVNFRNVPGNPQSSVFSFTDRTGQEAKTVELVPKPMANKFPHVATEGYD